MDLSTPAAHSMMYAPFKKKDVTLAFRCERKRAAGLYKLELRTIPNPMYRTRWQPAPILNVGESHIHNMAVRHSTVLVSIPDNQESDVPPQCQTCKQRNAEATKRRTWEYRAPPQSKPANYRPAIVHRRPPTSTTNQSNHWHSHQSLTDLSRRSVTVNQRANPTPAPPQASTPTAHPNAPTRLPDAPPSSAQSSVPPINLCNE